MDKIKLYPVDEYFYCEILDNGLKVFIFELKNQPKVQASFLVNAGGADNRFYLNDELINSPKGVAHFLEHQLFEQEDGIHVFEFFSSHKANFNAYTGYNRTKYFFNSSEHIYENLNFLLDYVQAPYFTDESVEKEKGIIIEEAKSYLDSPDYLLSKRLLENLFFNKDLQVNILGEIEDIKAITKKDLYNFYKAFYNPNNMALIITGNVDAEKFLEEINKNQSNKNFEKNTFKRVEKNEPLEVVKDVDTIELDVESDKVLISYKIPIKKLDIKLAHISYYFNLLINYNFGYISLFNEKLIKEKIIISAPQFVFTKMDDFYILELEYKTDKVNELIELISDKEKNLIITEKDLLNYQKVQLTNFIETTDSVERFDSLVEKAFILGDMDILKDEKGFNELTIKEYNEKIANIDLSNRTILKIKKKEKEEKHNI